MLQMLLYFRCLIWESNVKSLSDSKQILVGNGSYSNVNKYLTRDIKQ